MQDLSICQKNPVMTPRSIAKKTNFILAALICLHPLCSESPSVFTEQAQGLIA